MVVSVSVKGPIYPPPSAFNPADEEMERKLEEILRDMRSVWNQVPPDFQLPADCEEIINIPWAVINRLSYRDPATGKRVRLKELRRVLARLKAWCIENKNRWAQYVRQGRGGGVNVAGTKSQQRQLVSEFVGRLYIAVPPTVLRAYAEENRVPLAPQAWEEHDPGARYRLLEMYLGCREGLSNGDPSVLHLCKQAISEASRLAPPAYRLLAERALLLRDPRAVNAIRAAASASAAAILSPESYYVITYPLENAGNAPRSAWEARVWERVFGRIPLYKYRELLESIEEQMRRLLQNA